MYGKTLKLALRHWTEFSDAQVGEELIEILQSREREEPVKPKSLCRAFLFPSFRLEASAVHAVLGMKRARQSTVTKDKHKAVREIASEYPFLE